MAYNDNKHPYQAPGQAPVQGQYGTFEPQSQAAADYSNQHHAGHAQPGQGGWSYDGPRGPAGAGAGAGAGMGGAHVGNQGPGGVYVVDQPRHSTDCE